MLRNWRVASLLPYLHVRPNRSQEVSICLLMHLVHHSSQLIRMVVFPVGCDRLAKVEAVGHVGSSRVPRQRLDIMRGTAEPSNQLGRLR